MIIKFNFQSRWNTINQRVQEIEESLPAVTNLVSEWKDEYPSFREDVLSEVVQAAGGFSHLRELREAFRRFQVHLDHLREFETNLATKVNVAHLQVSDFSKDDYARIGRRVRDRESITTIPQIKQKSPTIRKKQLVRGIRFYFQKPDYSVQAGSFLAWARDHLQDVLEEKIPEGTSQRVKNQYFEAYIHQPLSFDAFQKEKRKKSKRLEKRSKTPASRFSTSQTTEEIQKTYEQYFRISDEKLERLRKKKRPVAKVKPRAETDSDVLDDIEYVKSKDDPERDKRVRNEIRRKKERKREEFSRLKERIREKLKR